MMTIDPYQLFNMTILIFVLLFLMQFLLFKGLNNKTTAVKTIQLISADNAGGLNLYQIDLFSNVIAIVKIKFHLDHLLFPGKSDLFYFSVSIIDFFIVFGVRFPKIIYNSVPVLQDRKIVF